MSERWAATFTAILVCTSFYSVGAEEAFLGRSLDAWSAELTASDEQKRVHAAWAIAQIAGKAERGPEDQVFFAELVKLTSDNDPTVRFWGVIGLGAFGKRDGAKDGGQTAAINTLTPLLSDKSPGPRIAAAQVLGTFGNVDQALAVLESAMNDPQESVRIQAVAALETLGSSARPAEATLRKATSDSSEYVKRITQRAIARLEAGKK